MTDYSWNKIEVRDFAFSGHANQCEESLRRSISAICRSDRCVTNFYIGIASGDDLFQALARRVDSRKMQWACGAIWALYYSKSIRSVATLEANLIDYYRARSDVRMMNIKGGGGGRMPINSEWNYLYLAFRRDGQQFKEDVFL